MKSFFFVFFSAKFSFCFPKLFVYKVSNAIKFLHFFLIFLDNKRSIIIDSRYVCLKDTSEQLFVFSSSILITHSVNNYVSLLYVHINHKEQRFCIQSLVYYSSYNLIIVLTSPSQC